MRGASKMNIHYDVTGLLTAVWRSHSGQIVWAAWINCELAREEEGGGGFWTHSTYRVIQVLPVADNWIDEDDICIDNARQNDIFFSIDFGPNE